MSRPHFHQNDRSFVVISGTGWVSSDNQFDPDGTVPVPAGSHVTQYTGKLPSDGAKHAATVIQECGMGPAMSFAAEQR